MSDVADVKDSSDEGTAAVERSSPSYSTDRAGLTIRMQVTHVENDNPLPLSRPAFSDESNSPPIRYFGDYELQDEIGSGGMGVIYRARQVRLNRYVALKMMRAGRYSSGTEIQRLKSEAQAAAQLDHPAIVPVFEVGDHDGIHYFTMALIDGQPLSRHLVDGPLSVRAAAALMQKVAEAVDYAHGKGVIHRDIKPGNILVDTVGQPRVMDFGLARQVWIESQLTATGQVLGTPSFMPPEQALGRMHDVRESADVYSLGATLYATLTGRPPFQAQTSVETLRMVVDDLPLAPRLLNPSIPRDLETICLKCLEKSTSRRYATAGDFADDLRRFLVGEPIQAQPVGVMTKMTRWYRRYWIAATAVAAILLMILGTATVLAVTAKRLQSELTKTEKAEIKTRMANETAQEKLWISYRNEANAEHRSRQSGQRFGALRAIGNALMIPVPDDHSRDELRTAAIAALCLPDLEVDHRIPCFGNGNQIAVDLRQSLMGMNDSVTNQFVVRDIVTQNVRIKTNFVNESFDYHSQTFSPDSRFLVYWKQVDGKNRLHVWSTQTGLSVADLGVNILNYEFRQDSRKIAVADKDGLVRILDTETFDEQSRFETGLRSPVVAWNPRFAQFIAMDQSRWKVIDIDSRAVVSEREVAQQLQGWPSWHPSGIRFAIGMQNRQIGVWDSRTGELTTNPFIGHRNGGTIVRFSPDGNRLISNDWSQIIRLWDPQSGVQLLSVPANGARLQFSPDGSHVAADCTSTEVRLFHYEGGLEHQSIRSHQGPSSQFSERHSIPCMNRTGRLMAIRIPEGFCLVDLSCNEVVCRLRMPGNGPFRFHNSGDEESLWTYGDGGLIDWPVRVDDQKKSTIGPPQRLLDLAASNLWASSRDGETVLIPVGQGGRVWNRQSGRMLELPEPADTRTCAISPDGKIGVTSSHSSSQVSTVVWDLEAGRKLAVLEIPPGTVFMSPDGKWLVTNGGKTRIWKDGEWNESRVLSELRTHACFSHDSKLLALSGELSIVRLIIPETGREIAKLTSPEMTRLLPLQFTPDGDRLITLGGETGALHIFDLRSIRRQLAEMNLDWDYPPLASAADDKPVNPLEFRLVTSAGSDLLSTQRKILPANSEFVRVTSATQLPIVGISNGLTTFKQQLRLFGDQFQTSDHLLAHGRKGGDYMEFTVPVPRPGRMRLSVLLTQSYDFGILQFHVNGRKLENAIDFFAVEVCPSPLITLGDFDVEEAGIKLRIEVIDTNPLSRWPHFYFALAAVVVEQVEPQPDKDVSTPDSATQ